MQTLSSNVSEEGLLECMGWRTAVSWGTRSHIYTTPVPPRPVVVVIDNHAASASWELAGIG